LKEVTRQTLSRLRIGIAGHVVLDRVRGPNVGYDSVGGVPTYAGLAVASLGHEALAISVVGEDGGKALEGLRALGVSTEWVRTVSGTRTTSYEIVLLEGGGRKLRLLSRAPPIPSEDLVRQLDGMYYGPIASELRPEDIAGTAQLYSWSALDPQGLMRAFDEHGNVTLMTSAADLDVLGSVTLLRLAIEEARALGFDEPSDAAVRLSRITERIVVITAGGEGAFVSDGRKLVRGKLDVRAVDTVGAGDVFGGAFLVGLMETGDLIRSTALGLAAVAERISHLGPRRLDNDSVRRLASSIESRLSVSEVRP
jgi:sugar/nucleoside kinase (ribokinase family)